MLVARCVGPALRADLGNSGAELVPLELVVIVDEGAVAVPNGRATARRALHRVGIGLTGRALAVPGTSVLAFHSRSSDRFFSYATLTRPCDPS